MRVTGGGEFAKSARRDSFAVSLAIARTKTIRTADNFALRDCSRAVGVAWFLSTPMGPNLLRALRPGRPESARQLIARYGGALLVVAATLLLRLSLGPLIGQAAFAILLIGILAAAWVGGIGPGLLSQGLILIAEGLWFAPATDVRRSWSAEEIFGIVAFFSVGGVVGALSEAWQAAKGRAIAEGEDAIRQREQLRATIGCVADGVLVTDSEGRVTLMNPVAERMTGWRLDESQNKPVRDVFTVLDERNGAVVENPVVCVLNEGGVRHETLRLLSTTRTDTPLPITISAAPIEDKRGKTIGVVLILRDETERHRTEEALRTADRLKDEFLATLAHELRNPLAPICMGLELLKHAENATAAEEVRSMMERQSNHMVRLIDELLDVSRISRGTLELQLAPVELKEIVRNAVDATRPAIDQAGHQLVVTLPDRPVLLYADVHRMTQVMSNLLNNAAKYTPNGGIIEVSAAEEDGFVRITVSDTGLGIPADMRELIFEMFTQVRDIEGGHQGLGIGLTLVKRLVELHGGTVEVESEGRNQGSQFHVRVPAMVQGKPGGVQAKPASQALPSAVRRRVLVVDDNVDALKALSMLVRIMGHDVTEAHDGAEAVKLAEKIRPEVVLMDIGMPNLNGYDATKRIRAESWGRDVVIVATTGWGQDEDRQRTADAGFDLHLVKPIEHAKLQSVLDSLPRRVAESHDAARDTVEASIMETATDISPAEKPSEDEPVDEVRSER
jgi:PAS domain S-box-containing protein